MTNNHNEQSEFLYVFGYESPDEYEVNKAEGTDYESAGCFKLFAITSDDALRWGRVLSDWYIMKLFGDKKPGRWLGDDYANWIETDSSHHMYELGQSLTILNVGEYPDFEEMRRIFQD